MRLRLVYNPRERIIWSRMIIKKSFNITRREFTGGMLVAGLVLGLKTSVYASAVKEKQADALLHLRSNGKVDIYSGGALHGAYANEDTLEILRSTLEYKAEDLVIITGDNPAHLPGFLGQNLCHMSFTGEKTNQKAAMILKTELEREHPIDLKQPIYIIEEGISLKTQEVIHGLSAEGIIVAVRQVV